ncbi:MAG: hypothetical protein NC337_04830 [Roseburia sp.]|nr:hypothetical protein [Roseburia sp.]
MKERTRQRLCQTVNAVIIAGVIILLTGAYYLVIKAGIPYQDPTPEMQITYAVNLRIGEIVWGLGLKITVCGGIIRLLLSGIGKRLRRDDGL